MQQEKERGYLARGTGYPNARIRVAHHKLPNSDHRIEPFQPISAAGTRAHIAPCTVGAPAHLLPR
jgi:hypothetical protein